MKAIIYDLDNTLLATNEFVRKHVLKTTDGLYGHIVTKKLLPLDEMKQVQAANIPFEQIFTTLMGDKLGTDVLAAYRATAPDIPYFATTGGLEAVRYFSEHGISQGILTNRTRMADLRLRQAGYPSFDYICSTEKGFQKPDPRAFDPALDELNKKNISKDDMISVGDHIKDYHASRDAGIPFYAVLTGLTTREEFEAEGLQASRIVDDLEGLVNIHKTMSGNN